MPSRLPPSPFINPNIPRFVLDETQFMRDVTGIDDLPVFLSDPSDDFIAAMHRDVLPVIEDFVRRAG